ncbi:MAG: nucleotidyl transferase AbiEii/AbiGii toxin family protein [Candidatus Thermoplasmatota archaeon]|jgi:hypothetical protein|nr:nucleotidyl transferase AbiEii/AbiGii toxin family protein [Candidatus Thermoplasmatota archaeon]
MDFDRDMIRLISRRTGLGLNYISKDHRISMLLGALVEWDDVEFAIKGGTAINRLYLGKDQRFSEDIDADLFGPGRVKDRLGLIRKKMDGIEGFIISGPRMLYSTARFDAFYNNEFDQKDRVMLDFNTGKDRPFSSSKVERKVVLSTLTPTDPSLVPVYSFEDLIAQKLLAASNRLEGKDIYDIKFSMEKDVDKDRIFKALSMQLELMDDELGVNEFMENLLTRRDQFRGNWIDIMKRTNHYILKDRRPEWRSFIDTTFDLLELKLIQDNKKR